MRYSHGHRRGARDSFRTRRATSPDGCAYRGGGTRAVGCELGTGRRSGLRGTVRQSFCCPHPVDAVSAPQRPSQGDVHSAIHRVARRLSTGAGQAVPTPSPAPSTAAAPRPLTHPGHGPYGHATTRPPDLGCVVRKGKASGPAGTGGLVVFAAGAIPWRWPWTEPTRVGDSGDRPDASARPECGIRGRGWHVASATVAAGPMPTSRREWIRSRTATAAFCRVSWTFRSHD